VPAGAFVSIAGHGGGFTPSRWRTKKLTVVLLTILVALWLSRVESKPVLEEDAHLERL
jgi:hypothetical protein